jgi:NADH-quinone oxidoreductase subunit C
MPHDVTLAKLGERFPDVGLAPSEFRDNRRIVCPRERLFDVLAFLQSDCGFDMLADLTAVDYLEYPDARDRFGVVYALAATVANERLYVKVMLNEPDLDLPSAVPLWKGADWLEREIYDMFGIRFVGHPDLRRILMPQEFAAFPLRKDYPLRGHGERHNFPVLTREES